MDEDQLSILYSHLSTLLEFSYYEMDSKKYVIEVVDYAVSSTKLRNFLNEKLADYESMTYQSKVKILKHLLNEMFDEQKKKKKMKTMALNFFLMHCLIKSFSSFHF